MMSWRVSSSAVAVSAMRGTSESARAAARLQTLGPEVVSPLADAVRLVDGKEAQLFALVQRVS